MHPFFAAVLALGICANAAPAHAGVFGGSNLSLGRYPDEDCSKPSKPQLPYSLSNRWEVEGYNLDVDRYNRQRAAYVSCLREYLENSKNDIARIREKMQEAVDHSRE